MRRQLPENVSVVGRGGSAGNDNSAAESEAIFKGDSGAIGRIETKGGARGGKPSAPFCEFLLTVRGD